MVKAAGIQLRKILGTSFKFIRIYDFFQFEKISRSRASDLPEVGLTFFNIFKSLTKTIDEI